MPENAAWALANGENDDFGPLTNKANALTQIASDIVDRIENERALTVDGLIVKMRAIEWCQLDEPFTAEDLNSPYTGKPPTNLRLLADIARDLSMMGSP